MPRGGGGGNAIYVLYGDVPLIRVYFLAFESETGCLFSSLTLKQGAKFVRSLRARVPTVKPRKEEPTFQRISLPLVLN